MRGDAAVTQAVLEHLHVRTMNALSRVVGDLVADGSLSPGTRLPTARDMAEAIGMSKSTVGQAWKELADEGIVETRGRGGTYVLGPRRAARARRFASMFQATTNDALDLANVRGDTLPRPDLGPALAYAVSYPPRTSTFQEPISEPLASTARAIWPYEPEAMLVSHGGPDGLCLYLQSQVRRGDRVIVEAPTYPRILDVIERAGGIPVPVPWRESGPDLNRLHRACGANPSLFVYQPSAALPFGASVTQEWADAAATILSRVNVQVLEPCLTPMMAREEVTLGDRLPGRVTRVQAYALWFSADLRCSLVGGPASVLEALWSELTFSTRHVSPFLQHALHYVLTDATAMEQTQRCVAEARRRVTVFRAALRDQGFSLRERTGPSLWLPVPDEGAAVRRAAARGITVFPGTVCLPEPTAEGEPQYIHVCATNIPDAFDEVTRTLREVALEE